MTALKRVRLVAAWLVGLYLAWMYLRMGWIKFDPSGFWTAAFERWGYPAWLRVLVGGIEVLGGVLLIIPWLASYGAIGVAAVMVGAWATRAHDGRWVDVRWISLYFVGLVWIAAEFWFIRIRLRRRRLTPARGL